MKELASTSQIYNNTIRICRDSYLKVFPWLVLLALSQYLIDHVLYLVKDEYAFWNVVSQVVVYNFIACFVCASIYQFQLQKNAFLQILKLGFFLFRLSIGGMIISLTLTIYFFKPLLTVMITPRGFDPLVLTV